ncbi:BQ2448_1715 [Microbotryum intermedium]|uniref:Dipeptidyl-peptidase V n=1 Tax=Microbotryum intermedium TaxID=269621 RepID=A0A238FDZ4_9BASI|nr:BQ2448_1715 [Microbotryum intermedium]
MVLSRSSRLATRIARSWQRPAFFSCPPPPPSSITTPPHLHSHTMATAASTTMPSSKPAGRRMEIDDLIQLPRPGSALPNPSGSYALWPSSTFSFKNGGQTNKVIYAIDLQKSSTSTTTTTIGASAPRLVLEHLADNQVAWIDDRVFVFVRTALPENEQPILNSQGQRVDHSLDLNDTERSKRLAAIADKADGVELWAKHVITGDEYKVADLPVRSVSTGSLHEKAGMLKLTHVTLSVSDLKVLNTSDDKTESALLSFTAKVFPDGDLFSVAKHKKQQGQDARGSDVRVYDSLWVRHWDEWSSTAGEKTQIFALRMTRSPESLDNEHSDESEGFTQVVSPDSKWRVLNSRGTALTAASTRGGKSLTVLSPLSKTQLDATDYAISKTHIVFQAKDPLVNKASASTEAWHTRTQVYLVPLDPKSEKEAAPRQITLGTQGASSSPVFSTDGQRIAWLEMREDGYEADRNRVMIYEVESDKRWGVTEEQWDCSPSKVVWCPCGEKIYLVAEDAGYGKLFQLGVPKPSKHDASFLKKPSLPEPHKLTHRHSVAAAVPLSTSSLLLTTNSFVGPNVVSILTISAAKQDSTDAEDNKENDPNPDRPPNTNLQRIASLTDDLVSTRGLDEGESFWFAGAEGVQVHGWVLFPPEFQGGAEVRKALLEDGKGKKKFPLAFLVHGGPQGAWTDSWSTRWNPNVFASHGYITVAINPTGSTGYGQEFCDRIKNQWGGRPYQDLVAGLDFVKRAYPEIDDQRMSMLGASYGGFMVSRSDHASPRSSLLTMRCNLDLQANWIQGHNSTLGFKCIVCHDGVFSTPGVWYTTEELYFPEREFGGTPWEVPENYSRWNPQNHISKWKTPQLVIHGGKDFRLVEGEGLAVFNTLQRLGVPSRLVYFESENHWVMAPHNSRRWHEEVFKWLDHWTSDE